MAWANFAILGIGGLFVAVPVLIHFLMQPKPVEVVFPAMRFLKKKQLVNRSRNRLRHLLLLLLRCLLIALLVLALAGPSVASQSFGKWLTFGGVSILTAILALVLAVSMFSGNPNKLFNGILSCVLAMMIGLAGWFGWKLFDDDASGQLLGNGGEPVSALVVLDTSPTMLYVQENKTRAQAAAEIAKWVINQFPDGSQISVASVDGDNAFFSPDRSAALRRLDSLKTSFAPRTVPETISRAWPLIEQSPLQRKEIYVLSDLTRNGWKTGGAQKELDRLSEDKSVSIFVVDVGVDQPNDFSLASLELSSQSLTTGGTLEVSTNLNRLGSASQRILELTVEKPDDSRPVIRDGKTLVPEESWKVRQTVEVGENGLANAKLEFVESLDPGIYHGKVAIVGSDPLTANDSQFFTFEVSQPWQALIVRPEGTDASVVRSVIAPKKLVQAGVAAFEATIVTQKDLEETKSLDSFDAIFLVDPKPMEEAVWQKIENRVVNGGGLAIFLGRNAAGPDGFPDPSFLEPTAKRLLTGSLGAQFQCPENDPYQLSPRSFEHPVMSAFRRQTTSIPWDDHPVFRFWGILEDEEEVDFPTSTVLYYNNFEPALIERQIGLGRVMVMTTPISEVASFERIWNRMRPGFSWPSFLVIRGIARYIVNADSDSLGIKVGQVASLKNDLKENPESWSVFSPDLERPAAKITTVDSRLTYRFTDVPGHYRLRGVLDGPVLRGFSANLDPAEVDLNRIETEELDKVFGPERYQYARKQDEITRQQGTARKGREFYPLLMMMMFGAIVIEYLVSNRFYKS